MAADNALLTFYQQIALRVFLAEKLATVRAHIRCDRAKIRSQVLRHTLPQYSNMD